ncbi:MAG: NUDIX hydrolase [Actinobacteria bacterium]|nr:NUDIX hydrolase [Actinomycetota bacterium]
MSAPARYCSHCGGTIALRAEDGRAREVCEACGTVFYRNPLPVAAAVVANERREILLVKRSRPPEQGMWCLPIGFAELDESIEEAALRELHEETGVEGVVRGLLDVDSDSNDYYGDLLIVTFEVRKTGGQERPGDDAADVAYFPLHDLPPIAFTSNQKAIAAYVAGHAEEWAIQESFSRLDEQSATELSMGAMLSDTLISLIESRSAEVALAWFGEISENSSTSCMADLDGSWLRGKTEVALRELGRMLRRDAPADEIKKYYRHWGAELATRGCPLHEALSGLSLLKRAIWRAARGTGVWERPVEAYRILEMFTVVGVFFDRAAYHTARGYANMDALNAAPRD